MDQGETQMNFDGRSQPGTRQASRGRASTLSWGKDEPLGHLPSPFLSRRAGISETNIDPWANPNNTNHPSRQASRTNSNER